MEFNWSNNCDGCGYGYDKMGMALMTDNCIDCKKYPANILKESELIRVITALDRSADSIACREMFDYEYLDSAIRIIKEQKCLVDELKEGEPWRIASKKTPARGEVVSVTVLEDNDRYECEAYIHELSGRWVYPTSSGTSIAGQVIAWRPKAAPYMGEF